MEPKGSEKLFLPRGGLAKYGKRRRESFIKANLVVGFACCRRPTFSLRPLIDGHDGCNLPIGVIKMYSGENNLLDSNVGGRVVEIEPVECH